MARAASSAEKANWSCRGSVQIRMIASIMAHTNLSPLDQLDLEREVISIFGACRLLGLSLDEMKQEILRSADLQPRGGPYEGIFLQTKDLWKRMTVLPERELNRRIEQLKEYVVTDGDHVHYAVAAKICQMKPYLVLRLCKEEKLASKLGNIKKDPQKEIHLVRVRDLLNYQRDHGMQLVPDVFFYWMGRKEAPAAVRQVTPRK